MDGRPVTECQIFLTRKCNINCGYCRLTKKSLAELTVNEWKSAFRSLQSIGIRTAKILGGEPTTVGGLEELLVFINSGTSIRYAILSNSTFTDEKLKQLVGAGLQGYFASVDGIGDVKSVNADVARKSHAGLDRLKKFREMGVKILGANLVINRKNLLEVPVTVKTLSDDGIWVNLCPVIHGADGNCWEYRTAVPVEFTFTEGDAPMIDEVMAELIRMKRAGCRIIVGEDYMRNMSRYGINPSWKCASFSQLRIDSDGALMVCNDIRGRVAGQYNVLDLDAKKFGQFKKDWQNDPARRSCPGCYWSCFWNAEENINKRRLDFWYSDEDAFSFSANRRKEVKP